MLPQSEEYLRGLLDAFDVHPVELDTTAVTDSGIGH
jgi:hypothetical protein